VKQLRESGVSESNGDAIFGLKRHLADDFTILKITQKPSATDEKCQWNTYRKSGSGNQTVTSFPT
jgi:hypothetical protein